MGAQRHRLAGHHGSGGHRWALAGNVGSSTGPSILWHLSETDSNSATHAWYYGQESSTGKAGTYTTGYLKADNNCPDPDPYDDYVPTCYTFV